MSFSPNELAPVALLKRPGQFDLYVFKVESTRIADAVSMTDEQVSVVPSRAVIEGQHPMIENLPWLHGMAFDGYGKVAEVVYD